MNKQSREALDAYYREARTWDRDREQSLRTSRRIAWIVAGVASCVAVLQAVALITLVPLKTVEPYTLLVDRNTGYVQALDPVNPGRISADSALTQSFLVQYVTAREGFDISTLQADYRKVALLSAETARSSYLASMQATNPQSPLARYPRSSIVQVHVKSLSPLDGNSAMVRFETVRQDAGGQIEPGRSWVSVIRYRYSGAPMSLEERFINPLGFQVVRYRRDAEALPSEPERVGGPPTIVQNGPSPATAAGSMGQPQPGSRP